MNIPKLILTGLLVGLLVWGLYEMYRWVFVTLLGIDVMERVAPALAGVSIGLVYSVIRQKVQQMQKRKLEKQKERLQPAIEAQEDSMP